MKKALILIDIQNDYFPNGSMELVDAVSASENAKVLLKEFREKKLPVVHIQHIAVNPAATFFIKNTKGAEIYKNVAPLKDEKVIVKNYPNGFRDTELLDCLKTFDVGGLVICGMMTHMCVDATTRAAKDFGFECQVIGDACATRHLEIDGESVCAKDVHNSFLGALNYYYSEVINTNKFTI